MVAVLWAPLLPAQPQNTFEPLSVDRPDVSNLPVTVRPGHYQVELGTEFIRSNLTREYMPNFLLRTGLSRKAELRAGISYLALDSLRMRADEKILLTSFSMKYRIVEEKGWRPSIGVQPEVTFPFGDGRDQDLREINLTLTDYAFLVLFNNTVHEKVFVNYNTGVYWSKGTQPDYLLSVSVSFMHTHRLGYFVEAYKIFDDVEDIPLSYDAGITFLLAPRLQVDIYGGRRGVEGTTYTFFGTGVGFRIDGDDMQRKTFRDVRPVH